MKERFVYGVQTMSMPGPDTLETASEPVIEDSKRLLSPGQSEKAVPSLNSVPYPSPLTTLLSRSDFVPFILELEKSLLVSREHDYAKAPDRVAILQASTVFERATESTSDGYGSRTDTGARAEAFGELLNCCGELAQLRSGLLRNDDNVTTRHLREVVGLQAALVREQQEHLYCKDRELASVRKERDQLEARLERMERRLAVHQKRNASTVHTSDSRDSTHQPPSTTPSSLRISRRHSRTESLILSERIHRSRSRSSSIESSRNRLRPSHSITTTPTTTEDSGAGEVSGGKKSARKRLRTEDANVIAVESPTHVKRVRKPSKLTTIRTKFEYSGLGLLPASHDVVLSSYNSTSSINQNDPLSGKNSSGDYNTHLPPANGGLSSDTLLSRDKNIIVPSWSLHPLESLNEESCTGNFEDISDDVFLRRHKKHEEDEKRRKRWDIQRARAQLEHQELLKKYQKKSGVIEQQVTEKKDKIVSLLSKLEDIEEIEVLPTVAVSAFGHPIPQLKRTEFELPWFDMDVREAKENVRTTRSKARASRTSAGSSDDS